MDCGDHGTVLDPTSPNDLPRFRNFMTLNPVMLCNGSSSSHGSVAGSANHHGIGCIDCDEELGHTSDGKSLLLDDDIVEQHQEWRRLAQLTWWYWMSCFTYFAVGLLLWARLAIIQESCPDHAWRMEAVLLLNQSLLAYLNDVHFFGLNDKARVADVASASFLALCQPWKLTRCSMDSMQLIILLFSFVFGLLFFCRGKQAFVRGDLRSFLIMHSLWHVAFPLGGAIWIEYTAFKMGAPPLLPVIGGGWVS